MKAMKAILAVLTVLVAAQPSFASASSAFNQDDPNSFTGDARVQAVAPAACRNREAKDRQRLMQVNGEGSDSSSRTAKGTSAGSSS